MADIDITRKHDLGLARARDAAERMAAELARKFDLKGEWAGDVLHFRRPGVTGSLAIGAKELRIALTLGLLLKAMKGSIERAVSSELDALFAQKAAAPSPEAGSGSARSKTDRASRKKGG